MNKTARNLIFTLTAILMLSACMPDVDNEYGQQKRTVKGAASGAVAGMIYSTATGTGMPGTTLAGAFVGGSLGYLGESRTGSLLRLMNSGVQVIQYGDNIIIVYDSDTLFEPWTSQVRYERFGNLMETAGVIQTFADATITIAAYADDVGNYEKVHEMTQDQAQSIMSFLWSHGVNHHRMRAIGYGNSGTVASNASSRGSAFNRRLEIRIRPSVI